MTRQRDGRVCPRCRILREMARAPDRIWMIVLPPHDEECPRISGMLAVPLTDVIRGEWLGVR